MSSTVRDQARKVKEHVKQMRPHMFLVCEMLLVHHYERLMANTPEPKHKELLIINLGY